MSAETIDMPEHDKLRAMMHLTQSAHDFLEFLSGKGIELASRDGAREDLYPIMRSYDSLLYEFFEINPDTLENEKRAMLDALRAATEAKAETTMTSNLDPAYRSPKEDAAYYGSIWSLSTNQMAMLEKSFAEHERTLSHAGEGVSETREQLRRVWAVVEIYRRRHDKMIPADCEVCAFIRDMDNALARPRANTGEG